MFGACLFGGNTPWAESGSADGCTVTSEIAFRPSAAYRFILAAAKTDTCICYGGAFQKFLDGPCAWRNGTTQANIPGISLISVGPTLNISDY